MHSRRRSVMSSSLTFSCALSRGDRGWSGKDGGIRSSRNLFRRSGVEFSGSTSASTSEWNLPGRACMGGRGVPFSSPRAIPRCHRPRLRVLPWRVLSLRTAADLLTAAATLEHLAPLARAVGCTAAPLPLADETRAALGLSDTTGARIVSGPGALRILLLEWPRGSPLRDRI